MIEFNSADRFYVEQCVGIYKRNGHIVELDKDLAIDYDLFGTPMVQDAYHSAFMFDEEMKEHAEKEKSVRGFTGKCYTRYLHWDFDSDVDLGRSQSDTVELLDRLESMGVDLDESVRVYFSGNKGFHLFLLSNDVDNLISGKPNSNEMVKFVCSEIADKLETFDSSVYDKTRIIRVTNSMHKKSGMYKIPLTISEVRTLTPSDIYKLAAKQREIEVASEYSDIEYIQDLIAEFKSDSRFEKRKPKFDGSTLVEGIYNGFENGSRNMGLTSLAGVLHSRNISDGVVRAIISAVNNQSSDPLDDKDINTLVESVSKYKIDEEFQPPEKSAIVTMRDARDNWVKLKKNRVRINTGFGDLDDHLYTFDPGKVLMIAARGGVGKTSLGMQLANNMAKNLGGEALFASLEMSSSAIFYRASQIHSNMRGDDYSAEELTDYMLDDDKFCDDVCESWTNMKLIDRPNLTIQQIEAYYKMMDEENGGLTRVLIVDYLGLVNGSDDYHGVSEIARELKNMAKRLNTRVIMLVQLSRGAGDGTIEPKLNHMRDSGSIEEAADIIIGMWRSNTDQNRIHCKFLKNRDGILGAKIDLLQHGLFYTAVKYDDSMDKVEGQVSGGTRRKFGG